MPSFHHKPFQASIARPSGISSEFFVFELRRWSGPRPNHSTIQYHGCVYDHGRIKRLVGYAGATGAVIPFPSEEEVHVALGTKIIQFKKKQGEWGREQEFPQRVGIHAFRSFPVHGLYGWSVSALWHWTGETWIEVPSPMIHGGRFAFLDLQEYEGVLYVTGHAGSIFALIGDEWKQQSSPTYQDIGASAVEGSQYAIAARTSYRPEAGGIWLLKQREWQKMADQPEKQSFRHLAFFKEKLYTIVDTQGIFVVEEGGLKAVTGLPVSTEEVLSLSANRETLFLATKKQLLLSSDGAAYSSVDWSEAISQLSTP